MLAGPAATARSMSEAPRATAPMTTIRFTVDYCNGCKINASRALGTDPAAAPVEPNYWNGPTTTIRGGAATLTVPTAYTPGLVFQLIAPWSNDDAAHWIILGSTVPPGSTVTADQAEDTKRATACWAGTLASSVTIRVKVMSLSLPHHIKIPLVWASPTQPTLGTLSKTYWGTHRGQDTYLC
jgi:hypothetical protein